MKEDNLIEDVPEPEVNNILRVENELETKTLKIKTEDEIGKQLGCGCRMNSELDNAEKELSYRCPNCPNRMKNICLFCLQNCHKTHINKLPADLFKNNLINYQELPCECALNYHYATLIQKRTGSIVEQKENEKCCPFNKLFSSIKPKYVYRRKNDGKIYCLFCINNFTSYEEKNSDNEEEENRKSVSSSSDKGSKLSFGSLLRKSIDQIEAEERRSNVEKENVSNDVNFYEKYDKEEVDYSQPFPSCECTDELHKHQIVSENIDNLYNYMTNIVGRNKINLDKLSYNLFNHKCFTEILFQKFFEIQDIILAILKDANVDTSNLKRNLDGNEDNILHTIEFDDKVDWEGYHKTRKLLELASKRLKILNFFDVTWLNDKIKKYFTFKTISKLLLSKSNYEDHFFKVQLFSVKIYRRAFLTNIPSTLLINENISFINRQLYNNPISTKATETFDEGYKVAENIFYLLDILCDDPKIDPKDYTELFVEALKIFKVIISYKTNDINSIMTLFRKIEDNLSNIKEKKENHNRIVHTLQCLIVKIFSYFNDNKFLHNVRTPGKPTQFQYVFVNSSEYNKEILSTLFNFDLEINEMNPYIDSDYFYDILVAEKDSYAESIENFLNASSDWKRKINKELTDLLHGLLNDPGTEDISHFFNSITMNLTGLLTNKINEKQFLSTSNQLINNLAKIMQNESNSFGNQISFVQNKYYLKILFLIAIEQRITKFTLNSEEDTAEEKEINEQNKKKGEKKETISSITNEINKNLRNLMIYLTKDNPLTCSILFNKITISLLLQENFDDLLLYYEMLKVFQDNDNKINTSFLTLHIHTTYCENLDLKEKAKEVLLLLKVYELILTVSSDKSILESNNIIALDLKYIIESKEFEKKINNLEDKNNEDFIEIFFNCLHCLQSEYFYIINPFIDITKIATILKDENINPNIRLVLTEIYTDYSLKNYFSTITIEKLFENESLITPNLVDNLDITYQQKQFQEYLSNVAKKNVGNQNQNQNASPEEKMQKILFTIFDNLEKYRYYHNKYMDIFNKSFSLTVSYFKNVILLPTLYSIYKLTYFPRKYTSPQKYDLYKLIFLYLQCYQYFINEIITKYNLTEKENNDIWSKFVIPSSNIEEMRKKINESVKNLGEKSGKVLDMKILFNHFIQNSKNFIEIKENFLEKENEQNENEEEKEDEEEDEEFLLTYGSLVENMNLFKRLRKEFHNYMDLKKEFEGNNVFDDIFQDEQLDLVQQEISLDLLNKLSFKKRRNEFRKQENVGYIFQSDLIRGKEDLKKDKKRPPNPFSNLRRCGLLNGGGQNTLSTDRTAKYGDYYNPYLSNFIESKCTYLEIIDKCFKSNPSLWQEEVVELSTIMRDLIYVFITNQLPFLVQFIFMEFNKIDTKESKYYSNFVNILEFLRLLCEDHNPLFQTMFINYEKSIGKVSIFSNDSNVFIPFITRIPIYVLLNIKHCLSKDIVLQGFIKKSTDYFNPLLEKITDFLIEIIQGTYPENFNDLTTSTDEISRSGIKDYIRKHYQFLDYLDTDSSYEPAINYFFRFFNCFVEENANPLAIKAPIMNIFHPKKLINVSINEFKKCVNKYIDEKITEECSEKLTQHYIKDYETIKDDSSFSLSLTIYLYFKRANSFKEKTLGDKYQQILEALKELYDADEELEENSNLLLRREYYQFCSMMIKETEISFTEDKSREDKEIFKYRDFFSKAYMRQVIEFRNKNCAKTQNLVNVFFLVHPDSLYYKGTDTALFLEKASYDNFNAKLTCIVNYYPEINQIIEMRKTLTPTQLKLCQINYSKMEIVNAICSIITNICLAFRTPDNILNSVMIIFAIIHITLLSLLILNWYVFNFIKEMKKPKESSHLISTIFTSFFNYEILPFTWTLIFGILAVSDEKLRFLFSLQLFPIFTLFDTMKSVIEAVKVRYNQFLSTGFLLVILILFYAAVTFYFFRFDNNGNELCTTYLHCFIYLFNSGIRAGGVPFEIKILGQEGFWGEFIYSWVFYFIVILIILNIVNGIIVDKFQDLREKNNEIYEEKENVCFICSLHRSNFEIKGIDFGYHQESEHNISNYFHYFLKINRTDEHDLNSIDFQVFNAFKERKIEFFPIKKAISLENTNS